MARQPWSEYFISLAHAAAARSTCDRAHVGAVAVLEHRVLGMGYNGSLPGQPHCSDVGHDMQDGHCQRVIHAEINLIGYAASEGVRLRECTVYLSHAPCYPCAKALYTAGVDDVFYDVAYNLDPRVDALRRRYTAYDNHKFVNEVPRCSAGSHGSSTPQFLGLKTGSGSTTPTTSRVRSFGSRLRVLLLRVLLFRLG